MLENEKTEKLRKIPFFRRLKDEVIEKLSHLIIEESFLEGDIIFNEGDPGDSMYVVLTGEGVILKTIDKEKGKYKSLGFIEKDDLVGEMAFFDNDPRSATITARTEMKLLKLRKEDLEKFFLEDTQSASIVFNEVIRVLSRRLRDSGRELVTIYETGKIIATSFSEEELLEKVFSLVLAAVENEDSGILAIYNKYTDELEIKNYQGFSKEDGDLGDSFLSKSEPLIKMLIDTRQSYEGKTSEIELFREGNFSRAKSVIASPIFSGDNFLGFIALFNHTREDAFASSERNLISAVCNQIAIALENVSLRKEDDDREKLHRVRW